MGEKMTTNKIYRQFEVWKKIGKENMAVYRCLEEMSCNKYMVDRVEVFQIPINKNDLIDFIADQLEMFIEEYPEDRLNQYDSIHDAIAGHDLEFENNFG